MQWRVLVRRHLTLYRNGPGLVLLQVKTRWVIGLSGQPSSPFSESKCRTSSRGRVFVRDGSVKPGTNKDVDFYCCSSSTARPPSIGWRKIGKGRDPAPASIRGNADKDRGEEKWDDQSQSDRVGPPSAPHVPTAQAYPFPTGNNTQHWPSVSEKVSLSRILFSFLALLMSLH